MTDKREAVPQYLRNAILRLEKVHDLKKYYLMSEAAGPDRLIPFYKQVKGLTLETRRVQILLVGWIEGSFRHGGEVHYDVTERETGEVYRVIHYLPGVHMDKEFGWVLIRKETEK